MIKDNEDNNVKEKIEFYEKKYKLLLEENKKLKKQISHMKPTIIIKQDSKGNLTEEKVNDRKDVNSYY